MSICQKHGPHGRVKGCGGCLGQLRAEIDAQNDANRAAWMRSNKVVPRELLLSWAAGLVRAVCGVDDEIGEPVRSIAMQMKGIADGNS